MVFSLSGLRYRVLMRLNSQFRHFTVGLLTALVGALLVTACSGGAPDDGNGAVVRGAKAIRSGPEKPAEHVVPVVRPATAAQAATFAVFAESPHDFLIGLNRTVEQADEAVLALMDERDTWTGTPDREAWLRTYIDQNTYVLELVPPSYSDWGPIVGQLVATSTSPAPSGSSSSSSSPAAVATRFERSPRVGETYIIRAGDTLGAVATRFGLTVSAVLQLNPAITNSNMIYSGQSILLAARSGQNAPVASAPTITVSDLSIVPRRAGGGCVTSRPLGSAFNLRTTDTGLCLSAIYDMAAGTRLDYSWTLNGTQICSNRYVPSARMMRGESLASCKPTTTLGSGTYAVTLTQNGQTVGSLSQYITRDTAPASAAVTNMSFHRRTADPHCLVASAPALGPGSNFWASDTGLCLAATYDMPVGTELRLSWTLNGVVLCGGTTSVTDAVLRGEVVYICKLTATSGTGTYAVTIQHNGKTVGAYSQYITRHALPVADIAFAPRTAAGDCDTSRPLGPTFNLRAADTGLCLIADYDEGAIPVGTALGISWTYNDVVLCDHSWVLTEDIVQGDSFRKCLTSIRGSGTYAVTITRGSETVGFYSQSIDVD